jgi:hypothetical protein
MNDDRCEGQGTDSLVVPSRDTGKQSVSSIMMFRPLKISIASHHVGSAGEQSYVWCVTGPLGHFFFVENHGGEEEHNQPDVIRWYYVVARVLPCPVGKRSDAIRKATCKQRIRAAQHAKSSRLIQSNHTWHCQCQGKRDWDVLQRSRPPAWAWPEESC